ncbi:hypothetical protein [Sodalis sp. C49]|uniref:hypothetical protein n=1 Tax=Sodalis sp. C49 TaxID=3228929 RepID=UPI003965AEDF
MNKLYVLLALLAVSSGALAQVPYTVRVTNLTDCPVRVDTPTQPEVIITQNQTRDIAVPHGNTAIYPASIFTGIGCHYDQTLDLQVNGDNAIMYSSNWFNNVRRLHIQGDMGGVGYVFDRSVAQGENSALAVFNRSFYNADGFSRLVTIEIRRP